MNIVEIFFIKGCEKKSQEKNEKIYKKIIKKPQKL